MRKLGLGIGEIVEEIGCLDDRFYDVVGPPFDGEPLCLPCLDRVDYKLNEPYFSIWNFVGDKPKYNRGGILLSEYEMDKLVELYLEYKKNK